VTIINVVAWMKQQFRMGTLSPYQWQPCVALDDNALGGYVVLCTAAGDPFALVLYIFATFLINVVCFILQLLYRDVTSHFPLSSSREHVPF
jgi:hypothetical protein